MAFVDMTVAVAMLNLDIGSEYLNLNHVIRVRVESESKVKVWFSNGRAEYFKDSKAEVIARWYQQNSVIPDEEAELIDEEEIRRNRF